MKKPECHYCRKEIQRVKGRKGRVKYCNDVCKAMASSERTSKRIKVRRDKALSGMVPPNWWSKCVKCGVDIPMFTMVGRTWTTCSAWDVDSVCAKDMRRQGMTPDKYLANSDIDRSHCKKESPHEVVECRHYFKDCLCDNGDWRPYCGCREGKYFVPAEQLSAAAPEYLRRESSLGVYSFG